MASIYAGFSEDEGRRYPFPNCKRTAVVAHPLNILRRIQYRSPAFNLSISFSSVVSRDLNLPRGTFGAVAAEQAMWW